MSPSTHNAGFVLLPRAAWSIPRGQQHRLHGGSSQSKRTANLLWLLLSNPAANKWEPIKGIRNNFEKEPALLPRCLCPDPPGCSWMEGGPLRTKSTWKHLETSPLITPDKPRVCNSGKALVWIPTSKFWPSTLRWLPEGYPWQEGEARPGYVPGIILFRLSLEFKCIPKAGGWEFSPEDVIQASFLSNLPCITSPSPSPDPLHAQLRVI